MSNLTTKTTSKDRWDVLTFQVYRGDLLILQQGSWFGAGLMFFCGFYLAMYYNERLWWHAAAAAALLGTFILNRLLDRRFRRRVFAIQDVWINPSEDRTA